MAATAVAVLSPEQLQAMLEEAAERGARRALGERSGLLTTEEAAELADVQPKTIRDWAKSGRLRVERRRGRRMFLRSEDVLAARSAGPADPGIALVESLRARSG